MPDFQMDGLRWYSLVLAVWLSSAYMAPAAARPSETWHWAALRNLTEWRSAVFKGTMKVYKGYTDQAVKQLYASGASNGTVVEAARYGIEPPVDSRESYALAQPSITCPLGPLMKVGGQMTKMPNGEPYEDGYKYLCSMDQFQSPCLVFSLGSRRDTSFERAVIEMTPCDVITMDCTVDIKPVHPRHRFLKKCLGSAEAALKNPEQFITWREAVQLSGHHRVEVLKIDIEGYEYDVLSDLSDVDYRLLPRQIAMELHAWKLYSGTPASLSYNDFTNLFWPHQRLSVAQMSLFLMHFASMGYGIVSRDDNPTSGCCTELTFYLVPPRMTRSRQRAPHMTTMAPHSTSISQLIVASTV